MYGLPHTTEVKRPLPKAQLYKRLDWKPSQRDGFDAAVARLDFTHYIAPKTLPAIAEGAEVKAIFVVGVSLKTRDIDLKNITLLAKSIPQRIVYALRYEDSVRLAVYHDRLFTAPWLPEDGAILPLVGINLDAIWENIVTHIGNFSVESDNSLSEQIAADNERARLEAQISSLEKKMFAERQPRRKRELYSEIKELKKRIN